MPSSKFVFPCPLSPETTLNRSPRDTSTRERFRNARTSTLSTYRGRIATQTARSPLVSDAHRHHDRKELPIRRRRTASRPQHGRIQLSRQTNRNLLVRDCRQHVEE